MPSRGEIKAVAKVLSDPENAELTAEEVAEKAISAYEDERSKTHNLIVLGHFRLSETESYVAAVGPLSTRAEARARGVGEHFAWDYKTRKGTGKYTLVPLIRNPNEAWDEVRAAQVKAVEQAAARSALSLDPFGPACICGLDTSLLQEQGKYFLCPRHPEESNGERPAPGGDRQHPSD